MAPVIPREPAVAEAEPAAEVAPSVASIVTPAMVATDAPTTADVVAEPPVAAANKPRPAPARSEPARPAPARSISHDDLPPLKPTRPRWLVPVAVAAALGLGVVGLRQLDRAPTPMPAELSRPVNAPKAPAQAAAARPASDDDSGDDSEDPNTGSPPQPDPLPPEPEPLRAKPRSDAAKTAVQGAAPAGARAPATSAAPAAPGAAIRINVDSDPPGARLFWKGKEQGTTPFVLELQPGERHAYELGLPGYTTRKVVIDGSKTDISIGLRPDPTATSGASPRK